MHYKTIMLELIEQRPSLHEHLKSSRSLLSTMERWAIMLRDRHLALVEELRQVRPESAEIQLKSEALEIAVHEIEQALPTESTANDGETFPLDEAMMFLRTHTRPG